MRNLPVLSSVAAGVLCSVCPEPGHCCERFVFHKTFWVDEGLEKAQQALVDGGVPFEVIQWSVIRRSQDEFSEGREYAAVVCSCPKLSQEGRCTIYETRPFACRHYTPGTDPLCVFKGSQGIKYWTKEEIKEAYKGAGL